MSDALKRFVVELASDVLRLSAFMDNAKGAMDGAGLSAEDQAIFTAGDQNRLYAYLKGLELPPPVPPPPPPQMPTVVAAVQTQGQPASAAAPPTVMASMVYAAPAMPHWTGQPIYYVMQWPSWPPY